MTHMQISLKVNGAERGCDIAPGDILLDVLRREGYYGVKRGCENGECGACTVLVDGLPVNSCLMFAAQADGREIVTVEGLEKDGKLHPVQEAFLDHGAVQCGFCTPGMVLSAKALLDHHPKPTATDVREALAGNLCRCTGYVKIVDAVMAAAAGMAVGQASAPVTRGPAAKDAGTRAAPAAAPLPKRGPGRPPRSGGSPAAVKAAKKTTKTGPARGGRR